MDTAHTYFNTYLAYTSTVVHAFDNLPSNSPFLELLVDAHCMLPSKELKEEQKYLDVMPKEFLWRMVVRLKDFMGGKNAVRARDCYNELEAKEEGAEDKDKNGEKRTEKK